MNEYIKLWGFISFEKARLLKLKMYHFESTCLQDEVHYLNYIFLKEKPKLS